MSEQLLKIADRLDKRAEAIFNNLFRAHDLKRRQAKNRGEDFNKPWPKSQMAGALVILAEEIRETLETVTYRTYANGGDLFTVKEFEDCVESGLFIDSDGMGYYAKEVDGHISESTLPARPSRIGGGDVNQEHTHVCWYNK